MCLRVMRISNHEFACVLYVCEYVCVCVHTHTHMCVYVYVCVYIYIYIYTHVTLWTLAQATETGSSVHGISQARILE